MLTTFQPKQNDLPKRWMTVGDVLGHFAMWAVRQSPYRNPDGLNAALEAAKAVLVKLADSNQMLHLSPPELREILKNQIIPIPEVLAWNERKNGNKSPFGFCSRHDRPDPDNDFIDLDALQRNTEVSLFRELERDL